MHPSQAPVEVHWNLRDGSASLTWKQLSFEVSMGVTGLGRGVVESYNFGFGPVVNLKSEGAGG